MSALILMYHDLANGLMKVSPGHEPYVLDTSAFRVQVDTIVDSKLPVVTVHQWCTSLRASRALVLTFDDGHVSNHDLALPLLLERQLTATFFITAGCIGTDGTMDWQQIRALHKAGMEIGSHTVTHRPPSTLNDDELRYELLESKHILEDGLGTPVTSISSPTGFFNPRMCTIAREVGYQALCFGRIGLVDNAGDAFSLCRIAVKRTMSQDEFQSLLRFDGNTIRRLRRRQWARELARQTLGPSVYVRLKHLFNEKKAFVE